MEPDTNDLIAERLFSVHTGFVAADYLAFLAERVSKNLARQLEFDGQPEIGMPSQTVKVADLIKPLSSGVFPTDKLYDMTDLLGYILMCYGDSPEKRSNEAYLYKVLYVGSLYLHCFVSGGGGPPTSGYLLGIKTMVTVSLKLDVQSRLQVCSFLSFLVPKLPAGSTDEPAPLSSLLLGVSLIIGSILSDVGVFTEHVMKGEFLAQEDEMIREWAFEDLAILKNMLLDQFGVSGKVRKVVDKFMMAIEQ